MYHSISGDRDNDVHPYYRCATTPETFSSQMAFLSSCGYQVISLERAVHFLRQNGGRGDVTPAKLVVITFDDGFRDIYTNAYPILRRYGFAATVFLPTGFISSRSGETGGRQFLSWRQVRELADAGLDFGSHSVSHDLLVNMSADAVERELRQSKKAIEDHLGGRVDSFSYPFAFPEQNRPFLQTLRRILVDCGYSCAVTTSIGVSRRDRDTFFLPRLPINTADDPALLEAKLSGHYDWMHGIQLGVKWARSFGGFRKTRPSRNWASRS